MFDIDVGLKFAFGGLTEVMHLIEFDEISDSFEARVNGTDACIAGKWSDIPQDQLEIISDDEYRERLDAFWATGQCTSKRVE